LIAAWNVWPPLRMLTARRAISIPLFVVGGLRLLVSYGGGPAVGIYYTVDSWKLIIHGDIVEGIIVGSVVMMVAVMWQPLAACTASSPRHRAGANERFRSDGLRPGGLQRLHQAAVQRNGCVVFVRFACSLVGDAGHEAETRANDSVAAPGLGVVKQDETVDRELARPPGPAAQSSAPRANQH